MCQHCKDDHKSVSLVYNGLCAIAYGWFEEKIDCRIALTKYNFNCNILRDIEHRHGKQDMMRKKITWGQSSAGSISTHTYILVLENHFDIILHKSLRQVPYICFIRWFRWKWFLLSASTTTTSSSAKRENKIKALERAIKYMIE